MTKFAASTGMKRKLLRIFVILIPSSIVALLLTAVVGRSFDPVIRELPTGDFIISVVPPPTSPPVEFQFKVEENTKESSPGGACNCGLQ
jgi:hypothetical protein